ncbi:MAG TPA: VOC family protein [Solirubrobacteraceae bacterium]|nr:VOC family protein [Solirubrobacteraceae bacterium]
MKLEGIHHVTAITADAPANVEFYAGVLGLRLVKKSVTQDDPTVYHLFYGDDDGSPGMDLTFFEYPGAARGSAGAGMVHRIVWRVASSAAIEFWAERLSANGIEPELVEGRLLFADPEGLVHELSIDTSPDQELYAYAADIPAQHALRGFDGVRAFSDDPQRSIAILRDTLGFTTDDDGATFEVRGDARGSFYAYDEPPAGEIARSGAGTVHHVAFASTSAEHEAWRERAVAAGAHATPIIDRFYFRSIYFREPSGVLFEIATIGPGFAVDEDAAHLGERLSLPPRYEPLRERLEETLTPLPDPRAGEHPSSVPSA